MNKVKKILMMVLSLVLVAALSIGGTVAYLQDDDSDVNVMTLGNVKIEQIELQRVQNDDGTYPTETIDGKSSYKLEAFEQGKMLVPTTEIDANGMPVNYGAGSYQNTVVMFEQIGSYNGMQVFESENAVDKFVFVKNTGNTPAYVRTLIAFEMGSLSLDESKLMTRKSYHGGWDLKEAIEVTIDGKDYAVYEYVYQGFKGTHTDGVLPAGATTPCSLAQVYLNSAATNETVEKLDGNNNGTYDILVLSQAVQADGFADAETALKAGFGEANATNVAAWFDGITIPNNTYVSNAYALETALAEGGNIVLTDDIAVTETMEIPAGVTATIDLNGQTITAAMEKGDGALLANKGTLNIVGGTMENTTENGDSVINNEGTLTLDDVTIVGAPIGTTGYPAYAVYTTGKLTVEDETTIDANRGAISMGDGAEVVINGGTFKVSDGADGRNMTLHTVYAYGYNSKVTINGGYFEQNHTSTGGASVICPAGATINVYGGDFRDAMDDSTWTSTGNFQNYMGYGNDLVKVYGGTYDDKTFEKWLADGYEATDNGDGTWTVGAKKVSASDANTAIAAGGAFELTEDVTISSDINNDVTIDLGDKTLTMTGSDLKTTGDLTLKNGDVDVSAGYFDVRSASDKEVVIEDVVFTSTKQGLTYGTSTDRVEPAMEFCPTVAGVKTTFVFRNCTFNNANVVFEAMSGVDGAFDVVFEECTFNLFGNSDAIEIQNYLTGTLTIKDCTFNITATSNVNIVDALSSSTVTVNFEGSNTVNGTAATPTTDPALVGTVDEVRVFSSQSVKIAGGVDVVNGLDNVTVTGIATK